MTSDSKKAVKILIADDSIETCKLYAAIVADLGATSTSVHDGEAALAAEADARKSSQPFDIVVLDIRMPKIDGHETAQKMRAAGFRGFIAAFTGRSSGEGKKRSKESGIDSYFDKRVANKDLFKAILEQAGARS